MSKALVKRPSTGGGSGLVPAIASAIVPGVGQLINGQGSKAIGVFLVWLLAGASIIGWIPIVGGLAKLVAAGTWLYGVGDAYVTGKKT